MKKIFTFLTVLTIFLFSFTVSAQLITISATHQMPVFGDSIHYVDANTFGFDAVGTGPVTSKVWDFAALMNAGSTVDFVFVDPSTLQPSDGSNFFPNANIAKRQSDATGYFYYENTATNLNRVGAYVSAANYMVYEDATVATEFHFPITAGGNYNTTYHGAYAPFNLGEDSCTVETGTLNINADMQGQMILPTGTFTGALRLHVVESFHIKVYMFGTAALDYVISDDYYYWFVDTILQPLVIYGITTVDGTAQQPVLRYQPLGNPLSISNINNADNVNIYPVPSNGIFTVEIEKDLNSLNKIEVLNNAGQIVYKILCPKNKQQINISQFAKGEYFVKTYFKEKEITNKILIK